MALKNCCWLAALVLMGMPLSRVDANWILKAKDSKGCNDCITSGHCTTIPKIHGRLVDHTKNHGVDRRIWARSLYQKRDLYVYLPPNYDKDQAYPVMIFMHGFSFDEQMFLQVLPYLDDAIAKGKLPPMIIAAPDGSLSGEVSILRPGSFFINSGAGSFEDFIVQDVWDHITQNYHIRPEREAHILAGVSMGGFGAFNLGIRHRNTFGIAVGIFPPLNLRWCDVNGNPHAEFDPRNWGWRTGFDNPREIIARIGLQTLRTVQFIKPAFGEGEDAVAEISHNNPIELIDRTRLRNGELQMFVGYGAMDEFNIDAQIESFLYVCKKRGIYVGVAYDPEGTHDARTARNLMPYIIDWLGARIGNFGPCPCTIEGRPVMLP